MFDKLPKDVKEWLEQIYKASKTANNPDYISKMFSILNTDVVNQTVTGFLTDFFEKSHMKAYARKHNFGKFFIADKQYPMPNEDVKKWYRENETKQNGTLMALYMLNLAGQIEAKAH